ncbi:hypothetical protein WDU94_006966 [Cyamophila willieti]
MSLCFSTTVKEWFEIELPTEFIQEHIPDLNFAKVLAAIHDQGVRNDSQTKWLLNDALLNCYDEHLELTQFTLDESSRFLLSGCNCQIIKEDLQLPQLPCDAIALAGFEDRDECDLYTENGFDVDDQKNKDMMYRTFNKCLKRIEYLVETRTISQVVRSRSLNQHGKQ